MPKFCANLSTLFTDAPFPARFARAAAAGFTAVEFQSPYAHETREVAGLLREHGLTCVMFNLPSGKPGEKGLAPLSGRQADFRDSHANIGIQMDFYHTHMTEGRLSERFLENLPRIRHVQISNAPGRHEPDAGEIDYTPIFKTIDSAGYVGWVGCEYTPRGRTEDGLGWMRGLAA